MIDLDDRNYDKPRINIGVLYSKLNVHTGNSAWRETFSNALVCVCLCESVRVCVCEVFDTFPQVRTIIAKHICMRMLVRVWVCVCL